MTAAEVIAELKKLGNPTYKKIMFNHGAKEPLFGVKVEYLKEIQKRVKKDHALALELYDTGIGDAQYLAGLISDPPKMTKAQLQKWVKKAYWHMLGTYTVAWVAAESRSAAEELLADMPSSLVEMCHGHAAPALLKWIRARLSPTIQPANRAMSGMWPISVSCSWFRPRRKLTSLRTLPSGARWRHSCTSGRSPGQWASSSSHVCFARTSGLTTTVPSGTCNRCSVRASRRHCSRPRSVSESAWTWSSRRSSSSIGSTWGGCTGPGSRSPTSSASGGPAPRSSLPRG